MLIPGAAVTAAAAGDTEGGRRVGPEEQQPSPDESSRAATLAAVSLAVGIGGLAAVSALAFGVPAHTWLRLFGWGWNARWWIVAGAPGVVLGFLCAIPAIVLGHAARASTRGSARAPGEVRAASAGLAAGYLAMIVGLIAASASLVSTERNVAKARRIHCASNLKGIGLALRMYSGDWDEHFPDDLSVIMREDYLSSPASYDCPSTSTPRAPNVASLLTGGYTDYLYFGKGLTEHCMGHDPDKTIIASDRPGNHRGYVNLLFSTGRVKGYQGASVEDVASKRHLFLPGLNLSMLPGKEQAHAVGRRSPTQRPPRVVRTVPEDWATDVDPGLTEIVIEFDGDMEEGFSWCGGGPSYPETTGVPVWRTPRVCVLPVRLDPARIYHLGINSQSFRNFRSTAGIPAPPHPLVFATRPGDGVHATAKPLFPQVVKTVPADGDSRVDLGLKEITVEFDRDMEAGFSWCGGGPSYPKTTGSVVWRTPRVCVLPVALEPGHVYMLSVNAPSFRSFRSREGVPVKPYPLVFGTAVPAGAATGKRRREGDGGNRVESGSATGGNRHLGSRAKFEARMARDKEVFTVDELVEIARLYRTARANWKTAEGIACYEKLVTEYKKSNRAGCAMIDLGYIRDGDEEDACFRAAIADHSDCLYGDGVQVGAEARFLLGKICRSSSRTDEATRLFAEIREQFPGAVDHCGKRYVDKIPK